MLTLTGSSKQVIKHLEVFRNVKSTHFTNDIPWTRCHSSYMNIAPERLVCLRTKGRKLAKAHVVLIECGTQIRVVRITKNFYDLECDEYNQIVDAFVEDYLTEEVRKHFKVEIREEYESLDTIMGEEAAHALEAWEVSCSIDKSYEVTCDNQLWQKAVLAINNDANPIDGNFLHTWLQKANDWKEEAYPAIEHYAQLLDYSNSILSEYRKDFDEKYTELEDLYENCELEVEHHPLFDSLIKERITLRDIRGMMNDKLFVPQNEDDLDKIATYYEQWIDLASYEKGRGFISKAIDICIIVLDEIGRRFEKDEYYASFDDLCPLEDTCLNVAQVLTQIMQSPDTKESMMNRALRKLHEVAKHTSFMDYGYFMIDDFIESCGSSHPSSHIR